MSYFCDDEFKDVISVLYDNNNKNSGIIVIKNETATLGNALQDVLSRNTFVELSGYSIPHPSDFELHVRIQTKNKEISKVLSKSFEELFVQCSLILDLFIKTKKRL